MHAIDAGDNVRNHVLPRIDAYGKVIKVEFRPTIARQ